MCKITCLIILFFYLCLSPSKVFAEANVVINEFLPHPNSTSDEWIEIYNPDNIDLTTYFIDDDINFTTDSGSSSKKQLTSINGSPYAVFTLSSSMFNNSGDYVVLFDQNGSIVDQYQYTEAPDINFAIGRSPDGVGEFQILAGATKGNANSGVLPTATLTPTKTPIPTKTPTPTKTLAPIKTPTPTRVTTTSPAPTKILSKFSTPNTAISKSDKTASIGVIPTSILGASISASPTSKRESKTLVQSASEKKNYFVSAAIIAGAILLISCGIIIYRKRMNQEQS